MTATNVPTLTKIAEVDWSEIDAAFCCLPHATTQEILNSLPRHIKVVDLSADFRLKDINTYAEWWGPVSIRNGDQMQARMSMRHMVQYADTGDNVAACWM